MSNDKFPTSCSYCAHHTEYWDECGFDGCDCNHKEGDDNYHINNCRSYVYDDNYKGCPYFKSN